MVLGLDFGFKHPTALIECNFKEDMVFAKELIYESHLTSDDLVTRITDIFRDKEWSKDKLIVADYARPEMIEDIRRAGFNIVNADKSVKAGIDSIKSSKLFYHIDSNNIKKEFNNYKWKKVNDRVLDEPVKLWDDALDALRYAVYYHKKNRRSGGSWEFMSF
jgi:phage terminase large subunit